MLPTGKNSFREKKEFLKVDFKRYEKQQKTSR
jgi:hypothetical protein